MGRAFRGETVEGQAAWAAIGLGTRRAADMIDADVETRPSHEQSDLDDRAYRRQIAYLLERSPFYREKLARAGFATASRIGGLGDIAGLPFTEKSELRSSCSDDNP